MSKLRRTSVGISTLNVDWLINVNDLEFISVLREQDNVTIYKAYWRKYQIVCVKKVVVTKENVKLVEREIDILSKCIHPMICQYFGTGILDSEVFKGFNHLNAEPTSVKHVVSCNFWSLIHEANTSIWQVNATRHLGVTLVDTVADSKPTSNFFLMVNNIEIH